MNLIKWFGYLALCAAFIWFVFFKPLHINSAETVLHDSENIEEIPAENSLITVNDTFKETPLEDVTSDMPEEQPSEPIKEEIKTENSNSINVNAKYLVVVGSFSVKANADRFLAKIKINGKDVVVTRIRGLHRVVAASSDNELNAQNLRNLYAQSIEEKAFVLER